MLNLRPRQTAKDMWEYLKKMYHQRNDARQFQLEFEIAQYTQGTLLFKITTPGFFLYGQSMMKLNMLMFLKHFFLSYSNYNKTVAAISF